MPTKKTTVKGGGSPNVQNVRLEQRLAKALTMNNKRKQTLGGHRNTIKVRGGMLSQDEIKEGDIKSTKSKSKQNKTKQNLNTMKIAALTGAKACKAKVALRQCLRVIPVQLHLSA